MLSVQTLKNHRLETWLADTNRPTSLRHAISRRLQGPLPARRQHSKRSLMDAGGVMGHSIGRSTRHPKAAANIQAVCDGADVWSGEWMKRHG